MGWGQKADQKKKTWSERTAKREKTKASNPGLFGKKRPQATQVGTCKGK